MGMSHEIIPLSPNKLQSLYTEALHSVVVSSKCKNFPHVLYKTSGFPLIANVNSSGARHWQVFQPLTDRGVFWAFPRDIYCIFCSKNRKDNCFFSPSIIEITSLRAFHFSIALFIIGVRTTRIRGLIFKVSNKISYLIIFNSLLLPPGGSDVLRRLFTGCY